MNCALPSRGRSDDGSAAVEAALVMSLLVLLVVGTAELGRAFWTYHTMLFAVEEAGRFAMIHSHLPPLSCRRQGPAASCPTPSDTPLANCAAALVRQILSSYRVRGVDVSVAEDDAGGSPATITICASYSFDFVAPQLLPQNSLNLTSRLTVPLT